MCLHSKLHKLYKTFGSRTPVLEMLALKIPKTLVMDSTIVLPKLVQVFLETFINVQEELEHEPSLFELTEIKPLSVFISLLYCQTVNGKIAKLLLH